MGSSKMGVGHSMRKSLIPFLSPIICLTKTLSLKLLSLLFHYYYFLVGGGGQLDIVPSEEFDLTKMSWGDHDILTVTSHDYFTATSF